MTSFFIVNIYVLILSYYYINITYADTTLEIIKYSCTPPINLGEIQLEAANDESLSLTGSMSSRHSSYLDVDKCLDGNFNSNNGYGNICHTL